MKDKRVSRYHLTNYSHCHYASRDVCSPIKITLRYKLKAIILQFPECIWSNLPAEIYLQPIMFLWRPAVCLWVILQWLSHTVRCFPFPMMSCDSCKVYQIMIISWGKYELRLSLIKLRSFAANYEGRECSGYWLFPLIFFMH